MTLHLYGHLYGKLRIRGTRLRVPALATLLLATPLLASLLTACAPQAERIASAPAAAVQREAPVWAFESSDIPVDPAFRFGRLENGMRYVIRQNATPKGTAIVRMEVAAGSFDESDAERGFAHFVEHMAFNGSTHVPEGEMVRLLERNGLAFGADTNASTGFERTIYMLDLPRNDPALLDVALMLMRETASELTFAREAIERERGVVLAEMRDRNSYQLREFMDDAKFLHPHALYPKRLPIGTAETLNAATADSLKAFWQREYVPAQTTVIVIGDFAPEAVEAEIRAKFASWQSSPAEPQPRGGPVDFDDRGRTGIHIDPALPERTTASRHGPWLDEPDSTAQRRENLLRSIGYDIVNRRFLRMSRQPDPPFRGAGFGTGDIFKAGRTTRLVVDTVDGKWRRGLIGAVLEYRKALRYGFTKAEMAEQIANIRAQTRNAAASADTRSHAALANAVFALLHDDAVPSTPQDVLERLEAFIPEITPRSVLKAMEREALTLEDPLLRLRGRTAPDQGEAAIRAAWNEALRMPLSHGGQDSLASFAYTDFGKPGTVVTDTRESALGIRSLRFANGVMLNIKSTDIEKDKVLLQVSVDGGDRLKTRDNPLATEMVQLFREGGLGKHSLDDLQTILAGRTVDADIVSTPETFVAQSRTTPRDLEPQLQLYAAYVTDPGYRHEGQVQYWNRVNTYFKQLRATPSAALDSALGGILSDNDPRFTLQTQPAYQRLTFAKLKQDLADRLAHGAIEIGIVGDVDEDQVIALVAQSFGALPAREPGFHSNAEEPARTFTADRGKRILRHTGPQDQALLHMVWPTRDDSDPIETLALQLLQRVVRIELTEVLREKLGKAYSPGASSAPSPWWPGYGTFSLNASVAVSDVPATRAALVEAIAELRRQPISDDILQRARQPMIEAQDNALKSNLGWMNLVDRAQTEADRIDRFLQTRERLQKLTALDVLAMAERYLDPGAAVEVLVLPEGVEALWDEP